MDIKANHISQGFRITGNWDHQANQLKLKYPELNEADLQFEIGQEMNLIVHLQHKLMLSTEEVIALLEQLANKT